MEKLNSKFYTGGKLKLCCVAGNNLQNFRTMFGKHEKVWRFLI